MDPFSTPSTRSFMSNPLADKHEPQALTLTRARAVGLLFFPLVFRQDIDYFLGLWRGVSGDFDLEGPRWLIALHYSGALTGLFASLLVMINGKTKSQNHPSSSTKHLIVK